MSLSCTSLPSLPGRCIACNGACIDGQSPETVTSGGFAMCSRQRTLGAPKRKRAVDRRP
ncbi:MAG: hypothetical protein ACK47W_05040 [Bacteroidota bacterium]